MNEYQKFISDILSPCAIKNLSRIFDDYKNGVNIDIEFKSDDTPASYADRSTETLLRNLISSYYPEHGIWGEEFGAYQIDNDYVWVLDPLDGTKEFLQQKPYHFGSLIGLLYNGKTIAGAIIDPISQTIMTNGASFLPCNIPDIISCTNIESMFGKEYGDKIFENFNVVQGLNCIGFAETVKGKFIACVEQNLSLHDIVALLPILIDAGLHTYALDGKDYANYVFDINKDKDKKFSIVTSSQFDICKKFIERALP